MFDNNPAAALEAALNTSPLTLGLDPTVETEPIVVNDEYLLELLTELRREVDAVLLIINTATTRLKVVSDSLAALSGTTSPSEISSILDELESDGTSDPIIGDELLALIRTARRTGGGGDLASMLEKMRTRIKKASDEVDMGSATLRTFEEFERRMEP